MNTEYPRTFPDGPYCAVFDQVRNPPQIPTTTASTQPFIPLEIINEIVANFERGGKSSTKTKRQLHRMNMKKHPAEERVSIGR